MNLILKIKINYFEEKKRITKFHIIIDFIEDIIVEDIQLIFLTFKMKKDKYYT